MSQKLDINGNIVGPYSIDDLRSFMFPEKKVKGHRREKLRDLHYDLIWEITEMQVKVYVQAIFPNQVGPPLFQLAKEQALGPGEKTITGESRSKALDKDISIAHGREVAEEEEDDDEDASEDEKPEAHSSNYVSADNDLRGQLTMVICQPEAESSTSNLGAHQQTSQIQPTTTSQNRQQQAQEQNYRTLFAKAKQDLRAKQSAASSDVLNPTVTSQRQPLGTANLAVAPSSSSSNARTDGRRRDGEFPRALFLLKTTNISVGCYTCKDRKKKCDCAYVFDETSGTQKCNKCLSWGIPCYTTEPQFKDAAERKMHQQERKRLIKLGKRKSRDEPELSRDRSMTFGPEPANPQRVYHSIETSAVGLGLRAVEESPAPVRRGTMTAIRGGKGGSKHAWH